MRVQPLAKCERNFILQSFVENLRMDGRSCDAYRPIRLVFGRDFGQCLVCVGRTKVFVSVSAEVSTPKPSRPQDGFIYINVEMSPMAAPNFELGRLGDAGVELTRLLEKLIKESGCVDTESLCLIAGEKVWQVRVNVHVLDDDGGLADAASVAAVAALTHFRRPDCSIEHQRILLHDAEEREFVPLNLYHYPLLVTFGLTENGSWLVVDATEREALVLEGSVVIGANKRNELCAVHCTGSVVLQKNLILKCASRARQRVSKLTDMIRLETRKSLDAIQHGASTGFAGDYLPRALILSNSLTPVTISYPRYRNHPSTSKGTSSQNHDDRITVTNRTVHFGPTSSDGADQGSLMMDRQAQHEAIDDDEEDIQIVNEMMAITNDVQTKMTTVETTVTRSKHESKSKKRAKTSPNIDDDDLVDLLGDIEGDVAMLTPDDVLMDGVEQPPPSIVATDDGEVAPIDLTMAVKAKHERRKKKNRTDRTT